MLSELKIVHLPGQKMLSINPLSIIQEHEAVPYAIGCDTNGEHEFFIKFKATINRTKMHTLLKEKSFAPFFVHVKDGYFSEKLSLVQFNIQ